MSNLREPSETFLGVSSGVPRGRGVGVKQAAQLIAAIRKSEAFKTGLLSDLSEMALYVEGIDRDKISDLTTNIIRYLLVAYTKQQCDLFGIPVAEYASPAGWDNEAKNWVAKYVELPFVDGQPVLLVPKHIVRRRLSLDSQEFYNKQITDFLVSEHLDANSSLVHTIKGGKERKVYKGDVRKEHPKSKAFIAEIVRKHPELLKTLKDLEKKSIGQQSFLSQDPSLFEVVDKIKSNLKEINPGKEDADSYHKLAIASLTVLFYPNLIQPKKEWEINQGRKRIDIVFTNAGNDGFFSQRRDDHNTHANFVIIEAKNFTNDIANTEIDQLLGRFDENRGRLGLLMCRALKDENTLWDRLRDAAVRKTGYIIPITDADITQMLDAKLVGDEETIEGMLHSKFRKLVS